MMIIPQSFLKSKVAKTVADAMLSFLITKSGDLAGEDSKNLVLTVPPFPTTY